MSIRRCPAFLQGFFRPLAAGLSKPQFAHLWAYVLGLLISLRDAKLTHLSAVVPAAGHRTRCGAFLSHSTWDAPALVQQATFGALAAMKPQDGEVLYLILDDSRLAKRGKRMDWLSKIWDHKLQQFVRGHVVLVAAVRFRGVVLPWRIELWKPKGQGGPSPRYRKITAMAADLVKQFPAPAGVTVRVLFDAFYLSPVVVRACQERAFSFFSVAAKNRSFRRQGRSGKGKTIASLAPGVLRHQGRSVHMTRARGRAVLRIASLDGTLSRIGPVRLVLSKRPRGPWRKLVAIATNETRLTARQIVAIYELRWSIEVLFKELACDLGLGDYQMISKDGIVHHLHLVCLAHLLLTHQSLVRLGAQATKANTQVQLPTMHQRLDTLRTRIASEQIDRLLPGAQHAKLRKELRDQLLAA